MRAGHRALVVLRGAAVDVHRRALAIVASVVGESASIVWAGDALPENAPDSIERLGPRALRGALGRTIDVLIFDGLGGVDADALGAAHGLVRGGGLFVLCLAAPGVPASPAFRARFAAHPHGPETVGQRFASHFERALGRADTIMADSIEGLGPAPPPPGPESEQHNLVAQLVTRWSRSSPTATAIVADRGRGKSSALGLALARLHATGPLRVAISAAEPGALTELVRFAGDAAAFFVPLSELCFGPCFDLVIIDEAAQVPNAMLRRVVERHPSAHLCLSTTTQGYEGTGRGFTLRFLTWLERRAPDFARLSLSEPIRWSPEDPVERFVFDALLLDAQPPQLGEGLDTPIDEAVHACLDRDALVADEALLRAVFGLLVQAHYRTTPRDLQNLLDAPNLDVHTLSIAGRVVAVSLVAHEGQLPIELCEAMARGKTRVRAHALADNLVSHLGQTAAGRLRMVRSVRIVVDPGLRRRGLASRLVETIHAHYGREASELDLFGTLFGATAELLRFRQGLGYQLIRVSASRGARTGEPAAMMLRPVSDTGRELVERLRLELARSLPSQLALLEAEGETLLEPALVSALAHDLPPAGELSDEAISAQVHSYAHGPRTLDSVIVALRSFVLARRPVLDTLAPRQRALIEARVIAGQSWREAARVAGFETTAAAMRALRPSVRALLERS